MSAQFFSVTFNAMQLEPSFKIIFTRTNFYNDSQKCMLCTLSGIFIIKRTRLFFSFFNYCPTRCMQLQHESRSRFLCYFTIAHSLFVFLLFLIKRWKMFIFHEVIIFFLIFQYLNFHVNFFYFVLFLIKSLVMQLTNIWIN